jgi:hypothetical protein
MNPLTFVEVVDLDALGRDFKVTEVPPAPPQPTPVPKVPFGPENSEFIVEEGEDPNLVVERVDVSDESEIVERPVVREVQR